MSKKSKEINPIKARKERIKKLNILAFLAPGLLLFGLILIAPMFLSGYYSLFDWNGMGEKTFLGFANYKELFFEDDVFWPSLWHAIILALLSVFVQLPISLGIALALGRGIKGERAFLSIYFVPVLISSVVIGQLFRKIYNPEYGLLNVFLRSIHLDSLAKMWLGDVKYALAATFLPTLWQFVGYHMLLMYAGVKSVPTELREAAKLDGASDGQVDRFVVIPYIKQIIKVSVIFAVTGSLKSFDLIHVLTNGNYGPFDSTQVPSTRMIEMLFTRNRYGMGSAIAVILICLCFLFALIIQRVFKEKK